jgi:cytoskeletal protein RodZ
MRSTQQKVMLNYDLRINSLIESRKAMLKNLFLGMFQWIASAILIVNLALFNPFAQPVPFTSLPIAASPVEQPSSATSINPQPSSEPTPQDESRPAELQRRDGQNPAQDLTSDQKTNQDQAEPAAPYDMEAIKAFNRALYGS